MRRRHIFFFSTINNNKQNGVAGRLHESGRGRGRRRQTGRSQCTRRNAVRGRRDHGRGLERPAGHDGARPGPGKERQRHDDVAHGPSPSRSSPSSRPGRRSANVRLRERRASRAVRRARESRTVQVRRLLYLSFFSFFFFLSVLKKRQYGHCSKADFDGSVGGFDVCEKNLNYNPYPATFNYLYACGCCHATR